MNRRVMVNLLLIPLLLSLLTGCEQEKPKLNMAGKAETQLPEFSFADLNGVQHSSTEWKGKVLVVNYWATWCPPCRKEMPLFIETQEAYGDKGVQFVGIAIDDPHMVQDFVDVFAINFPILLGDADAIRLSNRMGNRFDSLPFTAIFDREGKTRHVQAGEVTKEHLEKQLIPLL
jgi:thiol-disulfide isomerase/thioredoxin